MTTSPKPPSQDEATPETENQPPAPLVQPLQTPAFGGLASLGITVDESAVCGPDGCL
ncbi:hypothetical protein [Timonella senegalensis]|uniref:hypothetical protein n=1 Tax=Timonella senegalensis TaxID=1465825 RepID=UPI0002D9F9B2|nr:hypothetical protein [Timonella senegalensis]